MMRQLRESTKIIMIIVAISFVGLMVFEWGMDLSGTAGPTGGPTTLGSVNGAEISIQDFQLQYQILYEREAARAPDGLTAEQIEAIEQEAWEDVITLTLLRREAERRGIKVSDTEVVEYVKYSPPQDMLNLPAFQTDGRFDLQKYHQALADPTLRDTWAEYEDQVRRTLPIQKLEEQIVAGVEVTEADLRDAFREINERARIAYLHLDQDVMVPAERVSVSPEEIRSEYEANRENYRREASARVRWVSFRPPVTAADSARVGALADSLAAVAREPGTDFAELVEDHSDDPITTGTGGDLGWIRPETMDPALAEVLRDAQPGQILGPVRTPFGWHVLRFDDRQSQAGETRVRASQILIAVEPSPEARRAAREAAQEFARAAGENADAFAAAASGRGLEVRSTPPFERGIVVPGIGPAPAIADFVFGNDPGSVSGPLERDGTFYVVRVDERYPAGYIALDQVAQRIHDELVQREKREQVSEMMPEITAVVERGGLEGAAGRYGLQVVSTGWFNRVNNIPGIGSATPVAGAAFGLAPGQTGGPVEAPNGYYFLRVLEKEPFDPQEFESQRAEMAQRLR
ncbi:MAG TPA: peptidyl-prolyl cis-trans isomerase, partial [Gemmatimonadota bacterium]|nr:peptidyl-prolyl cis-trans isomerase [Gemmatimonadota bacterium]